MPHSRKIQPKDTNILVISLQYHLRLSTENCCMGVFLKHGNWVFLDHQAWDGGKEFGGLRRCCQWVCETHKISDWVSNLRHSYCSSSGEKSFCRGIWTCLSHITFWMSRTKSFCKLESLSSSALCPEQCMSCKSMHSMLLWAVWSKYE